MIACFDIATQVGVCVGQAGTKHPFVVTWDLRAAGESRPRRLLYFSNLCDKLFAQVDVAQVRYEAPVALSVMMKIGTSEETMLMLRGAVGILEACAARAGIDDVGSFGVQDARHHFIGYRTMAGKKKGEKRSEAKRAVMAMCKMLGIDAKDDNSADAVAGWHYCCALKNPKLAVMTTPLFRDVP